MWSCLPQLLRINLRVPFLELNQRHVQPVAEKVPQIAGRPQLKPNMKRSRMMMHTLRMSNNCQNQGLAIKTPLHRRRRRGPTLCRRKHPEETLLSFNVRRDRDFDPKNKPWSWTNREIAEILPKDGVEEVELRFVVKFAREVYSQCAL